MLIPFVSTLCTFCSQDKRIKKTINKFEANNNEQIRTCAELLNSN